MRRRALTVERHNHSFISFIKFKKSDIIFDYRIFPFRDGSLAFILPVFLRLKCSCVVWHGDGPFWSLIQCLSFLCRHLFVYCFKCNHSPISTYPVPAPVPFSDPAHKPHHSPVRPLRCFCRLHLIHLAHWRSMALSNLIFRTIRPLSYKLLESFNARCVPI